MHPRTRPRWTRGRGACTVPAVAPDVGEGPRGLDALLRPRAVAVIGASRRPGSIGAAVLRNILAHGFTGAVHPVNPSATSVQSVRAYASVLDIPDDVDLAVVVVPKAQVLPVTDDCIRKGVRGLVVLTAGFAETGAAGKALEDELRLRARAAGVRLVGPNCLGLLNTDPEVSLDATFAPTWPPAGNVSMCSQSGAVGLVILDRARELGLGIRHFVSMGNKADVSGNDLLEKWEEDPGTRVILLYLESFGNPARFLSIARRLTRRKPVLAVKSGRTGAGALAAASHTGAMAGPDAAVEALLGQAGVLRADTLEELFDAAMLLATQPVPRGGGVAIVSNAGGPAIMAADACEGHGLAVPPLGAATAEALRRILPPEASVRNPVDMIASAGPAAYERALPLILADEAVDAVLAIFVPPAGPGAEEVAAAIRRGAAGSRKPVLTCFMGIHGVPEALASLREGRLPSYAFPEAAVIALARAVRYGRWLARPEGRVPEIAGISTPKARAAAAGAPRWLGPDEVREVLAAYGIRTVGTRFARDADAAADAARALGFPVAVKLASRTITHKSEVGGVRLGLADAAAVREAVRDIGRRLAAIGRGPEMDGVVVQAMAPPGVETLVGLARDPKFGPLVAFGIGGVQVEVWRDVVYRVHPLTDADAREMVAAIRGTRLLDGFRGAPAADREALVDALLRVSRLAGEMPEVAELDVNPLVALEPGAGVVAVDARIRVG